MRFLKIQIKFLMRLLISIPSYPIYNHSLVFRRYYLIEYITTTICIGGIVTLVKLKVTAVTGLRSFVIRETVK